MMVRDLKKIIIGLSFFLIGACGGGDSEPTVYVRALVNTAPSLSGASSIRILEGNSSVTSLTVIDDHSNYSSITTSLSGPDGELFNIESGTRERAIVFISSPDHEAPSDEDKNNVYEIVVTASDGTASSSRNLSVSVTNAIEGRIVDGPLSGAQVFIDVNGNNEMDGDEKGVVSDADGFFIVSPGVQVDATTKKNYLDWRY